MQERPSVFDIRFEADRDSWKLAHSNNLEVWCRVAIIDNRNKYNLRAGIFFAVERDPVVFSGLVDVCSLDPPWLKAGARRAFVNREIAAALVACHNLRGRTRRVWQPAFWWLIGVDGIVHGWSVCWWLVSAGASTWALCRYNQK